ncbi:MAG TPA: HlyD family efflux transporter periplasmic adaptor subunit [Thermoanaerobaculia bacterium]|jgi:HlyD family secretion protein|nr:HlyD family efflux transporter periplasmic adaptor subunit [Thermoanaerobaculia bacterium]
MRRRGHFARLLVAAFGLAGLAGCSHAQGSPPAAAPQPADGALAVRRGTLRPQLLLSGEIRAAAAVPLVTPASPDFQLTLTWLAEDGSTVAAGQPVAQFDNSTFVAQVEEKRSAVTAAEAELARLRADGLAKLADLAFAVEQKRHDLAKARTAAAVPAELLSAFDYQDLQLKLKSAETELAKAEQDLATERGAGAADLGVQEVALAKARRELAAAESGVRDFTVRAPRAGTVLIADHPWEGRKVQVSDNLWPGMAVATLPDLSSTLVEAALSDVDDGRVAPGMAAACIVDAFPDEVYAGRVAEVAAVARESGRSALLRYFPVRIELAPLPPSRRNRLRPGMSVRVEIAAAPVRDALLVPRAALDLASRPPRALLAGGGAAAVRLGPCDSFWCVAESGVTAGQALRRRGAGEG